MKTPSLSCQYNVGKQLKLREEKLDEQLKLVNDHIQSLELAYSEAEAMRLKACEKFKEIEKKEKRVDFLKVTFEKRLNVVEEMEKQVDLDKGSLEKRVKAVEEREKQVDFDRGSLEKRAKTVEEREIQVDFGEGSLKKRVKQFHLDEGLLEKRVKAVEEREKQVDFDKGLLEKCLKAVGEREKQVDFNKSSLEKGIKAVEEREKQVDLDRRSLEKRVIAIEERETQVEYDEGSLKKRVKQARLDEELLEKRVKVVEEREKQVDFDKRSLEKRVKAVEEREKRVDNKGSLEMRVKAAEEREKRVDLDKSSLEKRLKSVEEREKQVQKRVKAVEEREKQAGFDKRSLDKRLNTFEEREKEFDSSQDAKIRELVLYEEQLSRKKEEFFKSANEKLKEGETLGRGLIKKFELALDVLKGLKLKIDGKFNEMESWEAASHKSLAASVKEAESIRESVEKRFKEFEKMEREFYSTREEKELELVLKEQELSMERKKFLKEVELKEQAASASVKEAESIRESVERRFKEFEKMEREFYSTREEKELELVLKEQELSMERKKFLKEVELKEQVASASVKEAESIRESMEKRFKEFEKMEKEFNSIQEEKERELVLREQKLSMERKELLKEVQLKEQAASASVKEVKSNRESMEKRFKEFEKMEKEFNSTREEKDRELVLKEQKLSMEREKLVKEVKLKEQDASHKSLAAKEAESIRESMQKRIKEFEKMEKEFHLFREEKERELVLKEQELSIERKELLKGVQLREQQLIEKQNLRDQLLNAAREAFADSEKEVEKRKEEFNLYKENRLRELVLQEEKFSLMKEEFIREVKFKEMKFNKQEKLVHGLLERLESAQNNVKNLKRTLSERFKEIDLKEVELESVRDWVEREMNDAKDMEDNMEVKENKLEGKKMKGKNLGPCAKELEYKEQQLEDIDWMEKNVDSKREFTRICSNEHLAIKNEVQPERDLVEKHDLHLSENEQQPDYRLRELNSKEKQNPVHSEELELKEQQLSDTTIGSNIMIEKDESVDLELKVEIEGELLELLIDAPPEKDFELIASEVYKLLIESSDPAKIVLDAVKELSSPHFRKREMVSHVGRLCILLLEKLTIISPTIRACVREEAIKLSSEWKSKMKATGQNPVEVFVFLNLLAAYKLANLFDKDELLSFLITVAEYKQTPELCRILGFTENMTDFVQKFIQKKQYLLASIYIYEFKLKHTFPQAAVLNYYLRHSKQLAKVKCNSLEAQDKAIVGEITALKVAIEHITKYGLEFDCSPDILKMQIKKLEFERKRLPQKQGKNGHVQPEDANTRNAVVGKQLDVIKEAGPASKAQRAEKRSSFGSNAQALQMRPKKRPANGHEARSETNSPQWLTKHVEEERIIHPCGAYNKRRRKNNLEAPGWNERMSLPSKNSIKHRLS